MNVSAGAMYWLTARYQICSTLSKLLENTFIRRFEKVYEAVAVTSIATLIGIVVLSTNLLQGLVVVLLAFIGWAALSYAMFLRHYFIPGLVAFGMVLPLFYVISFVRLWLAKREDDKMLENESGE